MKKRKPREVLKALEDREYRRERETEKKYYFHWPFHYVCLCIFFFSGWFLCFYVLFRLAQINMR